MHGTVMFIVIVAITGVLVLLIGLLLCASIIRRLSSERRYRELDLLRETFDKQIRLMLDSGTQDRARQELAALPKTLAWQAIEDVLLGRMSEQPRHDAIKNMLLDLGYVSYFEKQILRGDVQDRAMSIDKLGKMQSITSVPKLLPLLDDKEREVVSVTARSLCKIGGPDAMMAIIDRLPWLLNKGLVTGKMLETDLLAFGADVVPPLVRCTALQENPRAAASVLEIISHLPLTSDAVQLAIAHLSSESAEVRSRALKVLGRPEQVPGFDDLKKRIMPLLNDPTWYVRLQAIRSLRRPTGEQVVRSLKTLLFDKQWQVRNEAARALILLGEDSLDVLLEVLSGDDRYAKYSICEELEHTNVCARVMENLGRADAVSEKCGRIVEIMYALGFSTPLEAYLEQGTNELIKQRLRSRRVEP